MIIFIVLLVIISILLIILLSMKLRLGSLTNNVIYSDTDKQPGQVIYAKSLPLVGKPDYLIRHKDSIYPVEVKTGRTPKAPYPNHIIQLMAYCLLVEENYGAKPRIGFIKYPEAEFQIEYTYKAKQEVKALVNELLNLKQTNKEQFCNHPEHNVIAMSS